MGMIIFLPFIFDENHEEISTSNTMKDFNPYYSPNTIINRVYKSHCLIIYEIEQVNLSEAITTVSSQKNSSDIIKLYKDLRYEPISELLIKQLPSLSHVNIFGVVYSMNFKEEDPKCTTLQLFDFDLKSLIIVKLWRALATWFSSLSIGARLQIRNLVLKDLTLNSCSSTEIYLLGHGNSMLKGNLSARSSNLNEKEEEILLFLNHQSLLIPTKHLDIINSSKMKLSAPLYLLNKNNKWTIQGISNDQNCSVIFTHFDAKIWQILNEIFMDDFNKFDFLFERLHYNNNNCMYEFLSKSTVSFQISSSINLNYKQLDWNDLISSKVILFGIFELEAILDNILQSNSEDSLGNLSILPNERISISSKVILRNPNDNNQIVYIENNVTVSSGQLQLFRIQVKTILNDENVNEIIRKMIFIL